MNQPRITVIGSINMDLVTSAPRFPQVGETLLGTDFRQFMGGKGANQAVAAARLGAQVDLVGAVGDDAFGRELSDGLVQENVNTDGVATVSGRPTGMANITVAEGDNHIIVVSGANFAVTPEYIRQEAQRIIEADIVMAQLETPLDAVIEAAKTAKQHGKPFILNPAPAQKLPQELLELVTVLTPNAYELAISLGLSAEMPPEELIRHSPCPVVMTLGAEGALFSDGKGGLHRQASFKVTPVDTTGAGDTFNAALARYWHLGLQEAVKLACAAAAISVTQAGAQSGMPSEKTLRQFLAEQTENAN
ncbi:ribokinase [Neisseria weaveri]|uniref:ribokinase n=1 Tax=Neisseria weaveri TaxID=28091 RepID=UPI0002232BFF|nr:ribokinase [Neisseria weaveri]EGV35486.1 ribokinase [Neisseria weaveri ATCC 51223]